MAGKLRMLVLEYGPGWAGTELEGCTGMLAQMNTDDDKHVWADHIQEPRFRSSKQSLKTAQTEKVRKELTGRGAE